MGKPTSRQAGHLPKPGAVRGVPWGWALAELAPLRKSAIAKTEITIGREGEPYASGVPS